ncbi:MAG: TIGR03936 family radical SAM-associated protein, partial [Cyanobacteria bacterium J06627_8]
LPISYTGGFHPGPRISPANALPLGATSSGELVDMELTQSMNIQEFRDRLAEQLPESIPILDVQSVDVSAPSATQALERAEYYIAFQRDDELEERTENLAIDSTHDPWVTWIQAVLKRDAIWIEKTTKSGKVVSINMRERLFELEQVPLDWMNAQTLPFARQFDSASTIVLRYVGSCRNDGTLLRPEFLLQMLEQVSGQHLHIQHVHRQTLVLNEPA